MRHGGQTGFRRGLTLVELLVSIAVMSIILAIAITALRSVNHRAREMRLVTEVRTVGQWCVGWSADHDGQVPNAGMPRDRSIGIVYIELPGDRLHRYHYLSQERALPSIFEKWLGEPQQHWAWYTLTLLTDPKLWTIDPTPSSQIPATQYWRTLRMSDIAHPANKGMLYKYLITEEEYLRGPPQRHLIGFADGSADIVKQSSVAPLSAGLHYGIRREWVLPVFDTLDGAHGRDAER